MFEWAYKISVAAILFTAVSYVLPQGKIRNASMVALSFLFLTLLMLPLKSFTSELINGKFILETEKNELIYKAEEVYIEHQVMEHYTNRISEEIIKAMKNNNYGCKEIIVTVDENIESENFGSVLNVVCNMVTVEKSEEKNSVGKVNIPNIVIDRHGIKIEKGETVSEKDMSEEEKKVKDIISQLTGADHSRIIIRWSEKNEFF